MSKKLITYQYINELLKNQNLANSPHLQDIYSYQDYQELLKPVLKIIRENPTADIFKLHYLLFQRSGLTEIINNFIYERQVTPSILLDFGTSLNRDTIIAGYKQEYTLKGNKKVYEPIPLTEDTIFDLASTSKLFTSIAILKLEEMNLLDLYEPVTNYAQEFTNLGNVTIYDLLKFRRKIITPKRVDQARTKEEALEILYTAYPLPFTYEDNAYTDMGAMVLRVVIEKVTKMPFAEFTQEIIFNPLKMEDTTLCVPREKRSRCANENFSTIILKDGRDLTRYDNPPGTVHDAKSKAIGSNEGIAPGHAGYFSTKKDLLTLANALINEQILNKESLYSIADNIIGVQKEDKFTRFYGSLVYLKQPDPNNLSVYPPLSGKAFMSPGFAGTTLCLDPVNKITLFLGSNRLHNRIYQIAPEQVPNIMISPSHNQKTFRLQNGEIKNISANFTKEKEVIIRLALDLSLQYQLLEKIMKPNEEIHLVKKLS